MPDSPTRILRIFRANVEHPSTRSANFRTQRRAPRVSLHGSVSATIQLENGRKISARLHKLSITGGLLEVPNYLDERTRITLTIPFASGTVHPKAEMLFPMRGGLGFLQPFRITRMSGEELQTFDREITNLIKQSMAPARPGQALDQRHPKFFLDQY
jgi:hypothetical protein